MVINCVVMKMPNYYSWIGSVFKFDSNGNLVVNVQDSVGYDSANDRFYVDLKTLSTSYTHWSNLPLTGTKIYDAVANSVSGESIGTGDGSTTSFSHTTANLPVEPKSVSVKYTISGTSYTGTDDGEGNITGTDLTGTINYDTGDVSLTFSSAPDNGTAITMDYSYYTNGSGVDVSQAKDGFIGIIINGITNSTVYITPVINGTEVPQETLIYTSDTIEAIPVEFLGGTLAFEAYRLGSDYVTISIVEVRRE